MLKHVDDDGNLSVLANANQLVFVCDKGGHYWTIDAGQHESVKVDQKLVHVIDAGRPESAKPDQKLVRTIDADIAMYIERTGGGSPAL